MFAHLHCAEMGEYFNSLLIVSMPTWRELEENFRELASQMVGVRLDIQWGAAGEYMRLVKSQFCCKFPLAGSVSLRVQWSMLTTFSSFRSEGCCASHHS